MPKKRVVLLVGFVFVDVLGYSLFFPLLPYYAEVFGAGPALVGLMIASNAAAQFVMSPVIGRFSDRYGRRPLLILSIAGSLISFLLLGIAEPIGEGLTVLLPGVPISSSTATRGAAWTVAVLFFCRILDGLAGGNVSLARAYISDITDEQNRAKGLGLIGAAFGLGFVIGPAIGGTLSNWAAAAAAFSQLGLSRFAVPAICTALIAALNLLGVIIWLPESLQRDRRRQASERTGPKAALGNLLQSLHHPRFGSLLPMRFFFSLALTLFMANFALYARYRLGLSDGVTGYVMSYAGIWLILVQAVGIGWVTRRFPENRIMVGGLVVLTLALLSLTLVPNAAWLLVVLLPLTLSGGILNTVLNSLISKSVSPQEVGEALGYATSAESLSWVLAPVIGGFFIDYVGGWSLGLVGGLITAFLYPYARQRLLAGRGTPLSPTRMVDSQTSGEAPKMNEADAEEKGR